MRTYRFFYTGTMTFYKVVGETMETARAKLAATLKCDISTLAYAGNTGDLTISEKRVHGTTYRVGDEIVYARSDYNASLIEAGQIEKLCEEYFVLTTTSGQVIRVQYDCAYGLDGGTEAFFRTAVAARGWMLGQNNTTQWWDK